MSERLVGTREWASAIIESANHLMIATDPSGVVTWFNKAASEQLGYSVSEVVGKETPALWHDLDEVVRRAHELSEELEREVEPGFDVFVLKPGISGAETRPWTFIRRDGSRFPVQLTVTCVRSESGEVVGYLGVIEDLTDRERLIAELRRTNEELEEFAYRTSHDLRSPLVSSIALLETTRSAIAEGQIDVALDGLTHAENSLIRLEQLVRSILQLARTQGQPESAETVNLAQAVEASLHNLAHLDGFSRLEIIKNVVPGQTAVVPPGRLQLILENLISNAIKYQNPEEPEPWIRVTATSTDQALTIGVDDNGLGVPEAQRHKLFKMFKRLHSRVSFGSGLGLYMVKKSAELLGGKVSFEDPGSGARFTVVLPTPSTNSSPLAPS